MTISGTTLENTSQLVSRFKYVGNVNFFMHIIPLLLELLNVLHKA